VQKKLNSLFDNQKGFEIFVAFFFFLLLVKPKLYQYVFQPFKIK
jgi:hypothetical protein